MIRASNKYTPTSLETIGCFISKRDLKHSYLILTPFCRLLFLIDLLSVLDPKNQIFKHSFS